MKKTAILTALVLTFSAAAQANDLSPQELTAITCSKDNPCDEFGPLNRTSWRRDHEPKKFKDERLQKISANHGEAVETYEVNGKTFHVDAHGKRWKDA